MDGAAYAHAVPAASWSRWLHEVVALWWSHLPVWLALGALAGAGSLLSQIAALRTGIGSLAIISLLVVTAVEVILVHTAFCYLHHEQLSIRGMAGALHFLLPVLLLQLISAIALSVLFIPITFVFVLLVHDPDISMVLMLVLSALGSISLYAFALLAISVIVDERVWPFTALVRWWTMLPGNALAVLFLIFVLFSPWLLVLAVSPLEENIPVFWQIISTAVQFLFVTPTVMIAAAILNRDLHEETPPTLPPDNAPDNTGGVF